MLNISIIAYIVAIFSFTSISLYTILKITFSIYWYLFLKYLIPSEVKSQSRQKGKFASTDILKITKYILRIEKEFSFSVGGGGDIINQLKNLLKYSLKLLSKFIFFHSADIW